MKKFAILSCCIGSYLLLTTLTTHAAEFDPTYLISDTELVDYKSMDQKEIQGFLEKRTGTLAEYITVNKEGKVMTASQAFYNIAQEWMINPKYLLVLVQKEQSLLNDPNPKQGQYDRATGYGCPDSGGCDDRWKGFYRQVNSAAAQTRYYQDNIREFNFQPGKTYTVDGQSVTIKNTATAGLYNYTPHIHGNKLFWNLWNTYFSKKWPDGSLLRASGDSVTYLIENGEKRAIVSNAVLTSRFNPKSVIEVSKGDLNSYEEGVPIKFLNFALVKDSSNIYMIVDDQKRKFASKELVAKIGFPEEEIITAERSDLRSYKDGPEITESTLYPAGTLLQDSASQEIYYVLSGRKRLVINQEILKANFQGLPIKKVSVDELDRYRTGLPLTLPDGNLVKVKNSNTVYVIANNKRLPIFSGTIFERMGYKWSNVITVSLQTLEAHQLGQTITGEW
jgi:hypothetical protein